LSGLTIGLQQTPRWLGNRIRKSDGAGSLIWDVKPADLLCICLRQFVEITMHGDYGHRVRQPDAAEALAWLREAKVPEDRSITGGDGKGWRGAEALAVVQELYDLGADCVTAVEISGRIEQARQQDTSTLIIELPKDTAKRAGLFKWEAKFARKHGWDPTIDWGQLYLLIWRD
jgi:hypothetical protein